MEKTAFYAKENNFDAFSTTLLVSPYQDHEVLKDIGEKISLEKGIAFYYRDFRGGFREAHIEAREKDIYCQNYCGCEFSLAEKKKPRKK